MDRQNEQTHYERVICRWHRYAHSLAIFPGMLVAYTAGMFSNGNINFLALLAVIIGVEAISLLVAYPMTRRKEQSSDE